MLYRARHVTTYVYEQPVSQCLSETRITPRELPRQSVKESRIDVQPEPATFERRTDYFGNEVALFAVFGPHDRFTVTSTSLVEVQPPSAEPLPDIAWEEVRRMMAAPREQELIRVSEFVFDSPFVAASTDLAAYARPSFASGRSLAAAAEELSKRIHEEFRYEPRSTSIDMPLRDVLKKRKGVCQDFSHVMIGALRSLGLAARYISGYLRSSANYQGAEASHAWVSVYVPGYGWLDLDPTNKVRAGEGHVTVAWGRDYGDVTPVKGVALGGGAQCVEVAVEVRPAAEPDNG
jgi:transglutaminase-like putative cysteine protease